jgi:hypothetical protein
LIFAEACYFVRFEADDVFRVVGVNDCRHLDDDKEEDIMEGDIVMALWAPCGLFYEAEVLDIDCN